MPRISLKIDVDTDRGTAVGARRLAGSLERLGVPATFLFSLGPDHTGRAIRRVFRRGFVGKVRRTSVLKHYGARTLMYGTLLPGPHIGRRQADVMRAIARNGFEVGVHSWDHVKWQDGVTRNDREWARGEMQKAVECFRDIFGRAPAVHGAAGWQLSAEVPGLEAELGFRYASDARGTGPFLPVVGKRAIPVLQLPTTLPTLDELLGREDIVDGPLSHLLSLTADGTRDHVFTLHAELEGQEFLDPFLQLLAGWKAQGYSLGDLASYYSDVVARPVPLHRIARGTVAGRTGLLAVQGEAVEHMDDRPGTIGNGQVPVETHA